MWKMFEEQQSDLSVPHAEDLEQLGDDVLLEHVLGEQTVANISV